MFIFTSLACSPPGWQTGMRPPFPTWEAAVFSQAGTSQRENFDVGWQAPCGSPGASSRKGLSCRIAPSVQKCAAVH